MKFPRNARIFRGQLDAAPFAGVFFLVLIFLVLMSLVYTPGVAIQLPQSSGELSSVKGPTLAVAIDSAGRYYFENQQVQTNELKQKLASAVRNSREPLTLVVQADKAVSIDTWMRLAGIAREAGIQQALQQTLPRLFDQPATNKP